MADGEDGRGRAGRLCWKGKYGPEQLPGPAGRKAPQKSAKDTEDWILAAADLTNVKPILTPRFIPTCSDELMEKLSELQKKYQLPAQSIFPKTSVR